MSNTITQTIIQFTNNETNVTRMVLRPLTLFLREQFQNQLENQINNSTTNRLPYLNRIENVQSIDSGTIIELKEKKAILKRRRSSIDIEEMKTNQNEENIITNKKIKINNNFLED